MKKKSGNNTTSARNDESLMRPFTREEMRRGTVGKYYREVMAGSNVVRIGPDLSKEFPNEEAVNTALRELLQLREALHGILSSGVVKKRKSA